VRVHVTPVPNGLGWVLRAVDPEPIPAAAAGGGVERVQLGRVLEGVRDGVVVVGGDLVVEFANRTARALFAPAELEPGRALPDPWPVSVRDLVRELLEQAAFNAEALVEVDDRTAYWVRAYESGSGDTAVLLVSDVSAEERREQAERDFVAHAAHELQSPLTGIATAVEVLAAGAHEDEAARLRFLAHAEREIERLKRLLTALLALANAQATEDGVATSPFELRPLLLDVAASVDAPTADVTVLCPRALVLDAHRDLVGQAVRNLVANAVRHGSDRVVVSTRAASDGTVSIEVTDNGPGIAREDARRAFDRFYRGGARTGDGFGLGLAIVQQVARAHGGEATLHPNPGGGTVARLRLPAAAA
jgi:signal transduction histidine kinase